MTSITCSRNKSLLWDILSAAGAFDGLDAEHHSAVMNHLDRIVAREGARPETVTSAEKNKIILSEMITFIKTLRWSNVVVSVRKPSYQRRSTI